MPGNLSFNELKKAVAAGTIDTVIVAMVDMQGRLVGKRFQAEFFVDGAHEETHGCDYLLGIELVTSRVTKAPANAAAEIVMYRALEKGLSFKTTFGNVLTLTPPLTTTEAEMSQALDIIDEALASAAAEKP